MRNRTDAERQRTEHALRQSEARFRAVVESSPNGLLIVDRRGRIALVNREIERLFGHARDELVGQPLESLVPQRVREQHAGLRTGFFERPGARPMGAGRELFGIRKDGTEIPVEIGLNPIEMDDGLFVLASVVDISERKRAELLLRESSDRYHRALDNMMEGCQIIGPDWRYLYVNPAAARQGRAPREQLMGRTMTEVYPGIETTEMFATLKRCMLERAPQQMVNRFSYPDGSSAWFELRVQPVPEGAFILSIDITEHKRAEDELRRSNEELERFAYVASHDLQEPLRMVGSYVQLLAKRYKGKLDQDAEEFIGFALDGALRMQRLIEDLLEFSRVGTRGAAFAATDLTAVLEAVLASLKLAIEDSQAEVTHDPLPTVTADPGQLEHLLLNLVSNALKFRGEAPPRVHLSAARADDGWRISVKDNGIGIAPEYFERIFVIFQRLHGRKDYPGTGMGLAIAKKIVERHGGRIWVESQPGQGATFHFTLPATQDG